MSPAPKHTRRWLQFGLGTMFLAVTLVALVLGWELRVIHQRRDVLVTIRERQGVVELPLTGEQRRRIDCGVFLAGYHPAAVPFWRAWLGDAPVDCFLLPATSFSKDDVVQIVRSFPESEVWRLDTDGIPVDDANIGELK
jgi:hypothetical protein